MMMKKYFTLSLSMLFCTHAWSATQDLLTTYQQALDNDPVLQQAASTRLADRQGVPIAASQLLPQAQALLYSTSQSAAIFPDASDPFAVSQQQISRAHGYIASAQQNIIDLGVWSAIKTARRVADEADATYIASEQNLITRVATGYFNVLAAEDTLSFATAQKEALASQLDQTEQRFNVGLVAITDVHDFQAQYDAQVAEEIAARNALKDAQENLQVITGLSVDELAPLLTTIPLYSPEPHDMEEWVTESEHSNPQLSATRFNMQATEQAIRTEQAAYLPNLFVAGNYEGARQGQVSNDHGNPTDGWSVSVESEVNLFAGGAITAQVRQAQYLYEAARDSYEEQRRNTVSQTRSAYRAVDTAIGQVQAFQQAVISAQSALDANEASYEVGVKTSVDVLDSISRLYEQQQNLANARYNYILSVLQLKQAAGILEVMDLARMNEWLQLEAQT